jgi:hypothetical protein
MSGNSGNVRAVGAGIEPEDISQVAFAALAVAGRIGPYFAVDEWSADGGWRAFRELLREPAALVERVEAARKTLTARTGLAAGAVPVRVVASVTFLGVVSRLVSPAFGAAVLTGTVPLSTVDGLWWRPVEGGPWPLAVRDPAAITPADEDEAVRLLADEVIGQLVAPLLDATRAAFGLSARVLWGNVASALGGASGMLGRAVPERAGVAHRLVVRVLDRPPLEGTATWAGRQLVRQSCCLFYRIPGGGYCADCVLAHRRRSNG